MIDYYQEIAAAIDEGGADSIYLNNGFWDESLYRLKKGKFCGSVKKIHGKLWQEAHEIYTGFSFADRTRCCRLNSNSSAACPFSCSD